LDNQGDEWIATVHGKRVILTKSFLEDLKKFRGLSEEDRKKIIDIILENLAWGKGLRAIQRKENEL